MFDYHMHTGISFDSDADPIAMLRAAETAGLDEICFTEHYDIPPWVFCARTRFSLPT